MIMNKRQRNRHKYNIRYNRSHTIKRHENYQRWKVTHPKGYWVTKTRSNHRVDGYDVKVTRKELLDYIQNIDNCEICGRELDWSIGKKFVHYNSPTLDRRDNGKIITVNDIMILCDVCSITKSNRTFEDFVRYCGMVYSKFGPEHNVRNT